MNDFVEMERFQCPVCGNIHQHNEGILISKNLKPIKQENTVTGVSLCEEDNKMFEEGYIAAIEIDESKSVVENDTVKPNEAHRTGNIIHIRRRVFSDIFEVAETPKIMFFINRELFTALKGQMEVGSEKN